MPNVHDDWDWGPGSSPENPPRRSWCLPLVLAPGALALLVALTARRATRSRRPRRRGADRP